MRVALLSHNAAAGDAIGRQVAARADYFRQRGAEVRVFVESDRRLIPGLESLTQVVAVTPGLVSELRSYDLIIVDYGQYYPLLEVLPELAGRGPRVLFDYHGVTPVELWDGPSQALRDGRRRLGLVWYADQAVVHSEFMRRDLCQATGYPSERVFVMPLSFAAPLPLSTAGHLKRRLGLADERLLLFVGRLAVNKRVPVLIRALAAIKDWRPGCHAVIIGDGEGIYRQQLDECRRIAVENGIDDRVHFLGRVDDEVLADAYRSADAVIIPSIHEGCCIPAMEALAAGAPVIAARAAALPETVAGAGITFSPDDATDLAQQIQRVVGRSQSCLRPPPGRLCIVAPHYGDDVVGGAERSLRLIAESLVRRRYSVEVFTTGQIDTTLNGVRVRRFAKAAVDESRLAAVQQLLTLGNVTESMLSELWAFTRQSDRLLEELARRRDEFTAVLVGPYGNGLTREVIRQRPETTLLVPCFHREPLALQPSLARLFASVGGVFYHSEAERRFAEIELGISHPNASVIGTVLNASHGNADRGRRLVGEDRPYLLYAGRFCRGKNLPLLLDWLRAVNAEQPGRFRFAFCGDGPLSLPAGSEWVNLGYLSETDRDDVLAGAAALVQLSTNESLSLVALQAWAEGVPVIAHADCDVLRDFVTQCGGGYLVHELSEFRRALDQLSPELGQRGRDFALGHFGSMDRFADSVERVIGDRHRPLAELMRERGQEKAARSGPDTWQQTFAERVDSVLHSAPVEVAEQAMLEPLGATAVRIANTGNVPLWPHGPRAGVIRTGTRTTPLRDPLNPGQRVVMSARHRPDEEIQLFAGEQLIARVSPSSSGSANLAATGPLLAELTARLAAAEALVELPAGYEDVSEGPLAAWKRAVKQKLLHQFQAAYVDVLSRQQSALNRVVLSAIQELTECTELLSQDLEHPPADDLAEAVKRLRKQAQRTVRRLDSLERRMAALESSASMSDASESH